MSVFFLAVLAIAVPDSSAAASPEKSSVDWNRMVLAALKDHALERKREPAQAAAKLAEVGRKLKADREVPELHRRRLLGQIQRRLVVSGQPILAQQVDMAGAVRDRTLKSAEGFKELIEQTIEPESWDVNGGAGHIHVFRE